MGFASPLIRPVPLRPGDTVGIVAPASPPRIPEMVDRALAAVERLGYRGRLGRHVRNRHGFLAGSDEERAEDLMRMFLDDEVRAIFCLRGGYGSGRLLHLLDYKCIQNHPKIFVGYSDLTALQVALATRAGLGVFHGPTLDSTFIGQDRQSFSVRRLLQTISNPEPAGSLAGMERGGAVRVLRGGVAQGRLMGGNLAVWCGLIGTGFLPSLEGAVFFFEEVNEAPYRIDRFLTQLVLGRHLDKVAGIAVGHCRGCEPTQDQEECDYQQSLDDVLRDRLLPLGVPVIAGLPFGHASNNATLPFGCMATLDGEGGDLKIDEPAVAEGVD